MMKIKLVAIALSAFMLASGMALADICMDPKFYIGAELQVIHKKSAKEFNGLRRLNNSDLVDKGSAGFAGIIGTRFMENFGLEFGYTGISGHEETTQATIFAFGIPAAQVTQHAEFKHHNIHLDALGYLPLCSDFNLIASLGAGRLTSKVTGNVRATLLGVTVGNLDISERTSKTGIRAGLGAEYKFNDCWRTRLMFRYQKGNKLVTSMNSAALGLFYEF